MRAPGVKMRIESRGLEYHYEQFLFPDSQPHVRIEPDLVDSEVLITARLVHAADFIELLLLKEVLDHGGNDTSLDLTYLSGARMDRRISETEPFTLRVFADLLNRAGFERIRILDPHSDVATALLDAEAVYPVREVAHLLYQNGYDVVVVPDAGARKRVEILLAGAHERYPGLNYRVAQGIKHRDPATGKLSDFSISAWGGIPVGARCIILDDICDGGRTFEGLAGVIRETFEVSEIDLFVTHGVFSNGFGFENLDTVYATDSFHGWTSDGKVKIIPLGVHDRR